MTLSKKELYFDLIEKGFLSNDWWYFQLHDKSSNVSPNNN